MIRDISEIVKEKLWIARPLKTIREERTQIRLNIVTDDIGPKSLFGGVATSLLLASMLCSRNGWTLRIITRWAACNLSDYYNFVKLYGLTAPVRVEGYSDEDYDSVIVNDRLAVSDQDIYMATSWWSAKSILESNVADCIMYMIQEEETFFYPYGDERLWCEEMMKMRNIDYIVNSKLLYDYFHANGYGLLIQNAVYFEPAFPKTLYFVDEDTFMENRAGKKKLFFYGRPHNPRNLYYFGMQCLDEALSRGIIDTDLWEIYIAGGEGIDGIRFSNGYIPKVNGVMSWDSYAKFARTVDAAFCLMYTPHPSYPPLDMLCCGAVVVTNEFKNKKDLELSKNLIMAELYKEKIVEAIGQAVELAGNLKMRRKNYEDSSIGRDWEQSFEKVITVLEQRVEEGRYV